MAWEVSGPQVDAGANDKREDAGSKILVSEPRSIAGPGTQQNCDRGGEGKLANGEREDADCDRTPEKCPSWPTVATQSGHAQSQTGHLGGEGWHVGCSLGAAWIPSEAATVSQALKLADERMYAGKTSPSASREWKGWSTRLPDQAK